MSVFLNLIIFFVCHKKDVFAFSSLFVHKRCICFEYNNIIKILDHTTSQAFVGSFVCTHIRHPGVDIKATFCAEVLT